MIKTNYYWKKALIYSICSFKVRTIVWFCSANTSSLEKVCAKVNVSVSIFGQLLGVRFEFSYRPEQSHQDKYIIQKPAERETEGSLLRTQRNLNSAFCFSTLAHSWRKNYKRGERATAAQSSTGQLGVSLLQREREQNDIVWLWEQSSCLDFATFPVLKSYLNFVFLGVCHYERTNNFTPWIWY